MTGWVARLLITAALVAGCSAAGGAQAADPTPAPTSAPWPESWDTNVCYAYRHLRNALEAFREAYSDAESYDVDSAKSNATKASNEAKDASSAIDDAGGWQPGSSLLTYLTGALGAIRKGANLFKIGIDTLDAGSLKDANAQVVIAGKQIDRADTAFTALTGKYGFSCA